MKYFKLPVFGGEKKKIASNLWSNFSVSPDGKYVAFPRSDPTNKTTSIVIAATDGSSERIISKRIAPKMYELFGDLRRFFPLTVKTYQSSLMKTVIIDEDS